ncbi:MAG: cell division protein FtsA [Opitutales bacterium]
MKRRRVLGAVEIGTATVVVLVAEITEGRSLSIIGMGESTSRGIKKGVVEDFRAASHCVHAAIDRAEESAGVPIESVFLAVSGRHLEGFFQRGTVNIAASDGLVRPADVQRAEEEAKSRELPPGRVFVHHIRGAYRVDDRPVADPIGLAGAQLGAGYWSVHADERHLRDLMHIINGYGLKVDNVVVSSVASGCVVVDRVERKQGALVLDIGCGTTDYVLFRDGFMIHSGVVAVGGDHFTNDLALGLRFPERFAEKQKLEHGSVLIDPAARTEKVWLIGDRQIGDREVSKRSIQMILHARAEELFEVVKAQLGDLLDPAEIPVGAVLTGGASQLPGLCSVAEGVLKLPTRLGEHPASVGEELRRPGFSTPLGLLHFAVTDQRAHDDVAHSEPETGLWKRFSKIFQAAATETAR